MGEESDEIKGVLQDLRDHGVDMLTLGQYLQPSRHHFPVKKYVQYQLPIFQKCTSKDRTTCRMSGREGVRLYKALHRTVQRVFRGDRAAMFAARDKVTHGIFCVICFYWFFYQFQTT